MLEGDVKVSFAKVSDPVEWIEEWMPHFDSGKAEMLNAVGHESTAAVMNSILPVDVVMNRITVSLDDESALLVAQYKGPRLEEGVTELPEGAHIEWWTVSVVG